MKASQKIKIVAIKKGQRLREVARILGVDPSWLSRVIAGEPCSVPLSKRIEAWADGEIKASELLGV